MVALPMQVLLGKMLTGLPVVHLLTMLVLLMGQLVLRRLDTTPTVNNRVPLKATITLVQQQRLVDTAPEERPLVTSLGLLDTLKILLKTVTEPQPAMTVLQVRLRVGSHLDDLTAIYIRHTIVDQLPILMVVQVATMVMEVAVLMAVVRDPTGAQDTTPTALDREVALVRCVDLFVVVVLRADR